MSSELMLRPLAELQPKLNRAKAICQEMRQNEQSWLALRDRILMLAHALGGILCELKEEIGHGKWLMWLPSNFRELGNSEDVIIKNAERCMKLFLSNPNSRNSSNFSIDSIRKFQWNYIPVKERPRLEGDVEMDPGPHHLTFVNQFSKWDRQLRSGHVEGFDVEIFRRELEPMLRRIAELGGREWASGLLT